MVDEKTDELRNFEEIARYLNPSPGEIPQLQNVDIAGLSMPLRSLIGGDHTIYIDFSHRYDLDARIAQATNLAETVTVAKRGACFWSVKRAMLVDEFVSLLLPDALHLRDLLFEGHPG